MRIVRALWASGGVTATGGVVLVSEQFSTTSPWFYVGLTLCPIASSLFIGAMLRTQTIVRGDDDAFTIGYRWGFDVGRDYAPKPASLNVIRRGHSQHGGHVRTEHADEQPD